MKIEQKSKDSDVDYSAYDSISNKYNRFKANTTPQTQWNYKGTVDSLQS